MVHAYLGYNCTGGLWRGQAGSTIRYLNCKLKPHARCDTESTAFQLPLFWDGNKIAVQGTRYDLLMCRPIVRVCHRSLGLSVSLKIERSGEKMLLTTLNVTWMKLRRVAAGYNICLRKIDKFRGMFSKLHRSRSRSSRSSRSLERAM